jgi:hypothetical protein
MSIIFQGLFSNSNIHFILIDNVSSPNFPRPDEIGKLCEQKHTAITLKKRLKEALFGV